MFGVKKLRAEVEKLQNREKNICKIIDGYFKTNEKADKQYSIDGIEDRFYQFVMSVNSRINFLSKSHEEYKKTITEKDSLIAEKDKEIEKLKEEINADNDELAAKDEKIETQQAIILAQEKEIKKLSSKGTTLKSVKKNAKLR